MMIGYVTLNAHKTFGISTISGVKVTCLGDNYR